MIGVLFRISPGAGARLPYEVGNSVYKRCYVAFDYGSADVGAQEAKKRETLAKALYDRPALKLEIEGHADMKNDREGRKEYLFKKKIKAQELKDLEGPGNRSCG